MNDVPNQLRGIVNFSAEIDLEPYGSNRSLMRLKDASLGVEMVARILVIYHDEKGPTPYAANICVYRRQADQAILAEANGTNGAAGWHLSEQEIEKVHPVAQAVFEQMFHGETFPTEFVCLEAV